MKSFPLKEESERDWNAVAAAVLRGEFEKPTESEREAVAIGLRGYPEHAAALKKIDPQKKYREQESE